MNSQPSDLESDALPLRHTPNDEKLIIAYTSAFQKQLKSQTIVQLLRTALVDLMPTSRETLGTTSPLTSKINDETMLHHLERCACDQSLKTWPDSGSGKHDSLAEWSKALASGASPQGRGFEPHSCHLNP